MKYTHPLVSKGVDEIQAAYKEICDTDKEEIIVIQKMTGIPGKHENAAGHNDAEYLSKAVKQEEAVKAGDVKPNQKK
jgi:hypothetical protein